MVGYEYDRGWNDTNYLINNPARVDGEGNQIYLAQEVNVALPGKIFKSFGDHNTLTFLFEDTLTAEEKTTLDTTVTAHKENT